MSAHGRLARHRPPGWVIGMTSFIAIIGMILLTPLQAPVQQAILLGPDSLFPPSAVQTISMIRNGRHVVIPVRAGLVRENLTFVSQALHGARESYDVYLPPHYDDTSAHGRRYPVLYLLHGAPGQPGDWIHGMHVQLLVDRGIADGSLPPMIIIMPEGNGGVWHDSQYVNTHSGFRAEDLITHDVVSYVDAHYRTIADRRARAIAGISEGGYGAMNLGLRHPNIFGTIVSISGYFAADPAEVFFGNDPWGHDWALMRANSPVDYVRRLAGRHDINILIMDNTSDGAYTRDARRFDAVLTRWHIAHTLRLQAAPNPLAAHYWPYWRQAFPQALFYVAHHLLTT